MGKKLVISERQYHLLKEQNELSKQLPQCITSDIDGGNTPFSNLSIFSFGASGALKKLAMNGYSNAIDSFVDDVTKIRGCHKGAIGKDLLLLYQGQFLKVY